MFKTIKNAWKTPELRKKILYTLVLIVIFRLGCYITIPGVDALALDEAMKNSNGIAGLINLISGGAFARFSIFAMSITPYINASIIIQLLGFVIPSLERLTKEGGEEGRQKINKYTKILTIVLALIEGLGLYFSYSSNTALQIFINPGFLTAAIVVIGFMAGTSLLIWLGEQITNKGVGNGISMIIFVGIISRMPSAVVTIWNLIITSQGFSTVGLFFVPIYGLSSQIPKNVNFFHFVFCDLAFLKNVFIDLLSPNVKEYGDNKPKERDTSCSQ